jgi:iron complex outermembrane receptor protein
VCVGLAGSLGPSLALAQSTGAAAPPAITSLDEVVVTAQFRRESLQKVPVSVVALDSEALAANGVTNLDTVALATPGLQMASIGTVSAPFIRGVGSTAPAPGKQASVATYVDGVLIAAQAASLFDFNNVESVEVLKGPQGTLFGRNSSGGVIRIQTKRPSHDDGGSLMLGYGNYDTSELRAYGTAGLSDAVAVDLAIAASDQREGWGRYVNNGLPAHLGRSFAARSKLEYAVDGTTITLAADFSRVRADAGAAQSLPVGSVGLDGSTNVGFYNVNLNLESYADVRQGGVSATVEHDFGFARLTSISAARRTKVYLQIDVDATPAPIINAFLPNHEDQYSQELRLVSQGPAPFDWILGAYAFRGIAESGPIGVNGLAFSFLPLPLSNQVMSAQRLETTSLAAYAQGVYHFGPDTRLAVGLRGTHDKQTINARQYMSPQNINLGTYSGEISTDTPTYDASLSHDFNPDLTGYLRYARGFQAGSYNYLSFGNPPVKPEYIDAYEVGLKGSILEQRLRFGMAAFYYDFKDLQVQQFEGTTTRLINAGAARIKGLEFEATARPIPPLVLQGSVSLLDPKFTSFPNAPTFARNPAGGLIPVTGPGCVSPGACDASGHDLPYASKFTANLSARYTADLSLGELEATGAASYNGGFYGDPQNRLKQSAYVWLTASAKFTPRGHAYSIGVWGKNLGGEKVYSSLQAQAPGDVANPLPPRTFGVTLETTF